MAIMQPTISMVLTTLLLTVAMVVTLAAGGGGNENGKPKTQDLVVEACKNMSHDLLLNKKTHFHEEPCVSVLRSDNRSMLAKGYSDLVVIALDLLDHRSNKAMARIDGELRGLKVHNWTERAFQYCSSDYAAVVRTVPVCRDMFVGLTKQWGENIPCFVPERDDATMALGCLDRIGEAASDCYLLLSSHWDDDGAEEFEDVIRYISLALGLMEIATQCRDTDSTW